MIAYFEPESEKEERLLQEMYDSGLFWAINHGILHQHGLAIGVTSRADTPEIPERLIIVKIDPEGDDGAIVFSAAAGLKGYKKYLDYIGERFKGAPTREMDAEGEVYE